MTDFNFIPTKPHQSGEGEFALLRMPWAGHNFARKALGLVSSSTRITSPPTEGRLRCWQQENHSANSWRNTSNVALALAARLRFASSLGGRRASMHSFNV